MKERLAYAGFRLGVGLVGVLPLEVATAGAGWLGSVVGPALRGRWAMVLRHGRRLGVPEQDLTRHARGVFSAYGRYWAEAFWVRPRRRAEIESTTEAEGLEHVDDAKRAGSGMIFALPHVGNWEFAGPVAESLGLELVAVAENLPNRRIRDWFISLRRDMGIGIVLAGPGATRKLEEVLERNGAVALLCDRDLSGRGVRVEFFGEETTLPAGPVRLSARTGAVLLPVASYFRPGGGHLVHVGAPIPVDADDEDVLGSGTARLAGALEELILRAPEQWHLLQPNWPTDREG